MSIDLERALSAMAAQAESAARPVDVGRVLTRMQRRRTARTVATSAAGVAAAGAVAVAGTTLAQTRRPAPPVATPSPSPVSSWSAVTASGAFVCGQPAPTVVDPEGEADLHLRVGLGVPDIGLDPSLEVPPGVTVLPFSDTPLITVTLANGTDTDLTATVTAADAVSVWLLRDGEVVGRGATSPASGDVTLDVPAGGDSIPPVTGNELPTFGHWEGSVSMEACDGSLLPDGVYDLVVEQHLGELRGPGGASAASALTVVSAPWPVMLAGGSRGATQEPTPAVDDAQGPPPLEDLVLTTAGLGPLAIGSDVPSSPSASDLVVWDPVACEGQEEAGRWVSNYPGGLVGPFFVQREWLGEQSGDRIVRIGVIAPGPHTEGGIGVGSSVEELRAAHPDATLLGTGPEVSSGESVDTYTWSDVSGVVVVDVSRGDPGDDVPAGTVKALGVQTHDFPRTSSADNPSGHVPVGGGEFCG